MANTTNYNWETPDDTDLVKDGAAAIRTLGSSIDTTTKALNPETTLGDIAYRSATANTNTRLAVGTTGQVLTVAGGVPSWATPTVGDITAVTAGTGISGGGTTGDVTITNSMATAIDAKGDLIVGTGADTFSRLAAGTNTYVLTADSAEATGLKWAAPSGGSTFVGVKVTANADQSIANDTATDVTWNTEEYDTDAFHSTSTNTNRLTVPSGKAGYYKIFFCVKFTNSANATGRRIISLQLNGTEIADYETHALSGVFPTMVLSITKYLEVADYVALQAYQSSGASLDLRKNASPGSFGMEKIG
jgi:hypothetical protein